MGPITFCFSVAGSGILQLRDNLSQRRQRLLFAGVMILLLVIALPVWLSPQWHENFGVIEPKTHTRYEQQGFGIAVLPPSYSLPSTLPTSTTTHRFLSAGYETGTISRFDPSQITTRTQVSLLDTNSHNQSHQVRIAEPTTIQLFIAYFDGWQAASQVATVATQRNPETGLLNVILPTIEEDSNLQIRLGATFVRSVGWAISSITLICMIILVWVRLRHDTEIYYDDTILLSSAEVRLLIVVQVCFGLLIILLFVMAPQNPLRASPGYTLYNIQPLRHRTSAAIETLGYDLSQTQYSVGDTIEFSIYWQATRFLTDNYQVRVYLDNGTSNISWFRTPLRHPGHYPTRRWLRNRFVKDKHFILISSDAIAGTYHIVIELYECAENCSRDNRLNFYDSQGNVIGQRLKLPTPITLQTH